MSNGKIMRMNPASVPATPQTAQWQGPSPQWGGAPASWCCPDDSVPPFPCPPPGWPPPGCPPWFSGQNSPPWYPGANAGVSFGAIAPANPVRGHFWWDGSVLWMFDGAAWVATGGENINTTPPSSNPPSNPANGQQWFNGTTLYVWDGNAWIPVSATKTTISATAPSGPNPGDLWYNGSVLYIWSGSAWGLVGPGATVGPVPTTTLVLQIVQTPVGTAFPGMSAAWNTLPITATPQIDSETGWNPTTHQYKPTTAGIYMFEVGLTAWANAGYNMGFLLARNDTGVIDNSVDLVIGWLGGGGASEVFWQTGTATRHMNGSTDYVRMYGFAAGGTSNSYIAPASSPLLRATLMP